MGRVYSLHCYELRPGVSQEEVLRLFRQAGEEGLFGLPGLLEAHLLTGLKGARAGRLAALWVYESREAWEALWGPPEAPRPPQAYPQRWRRWEELLRPLLDREPDRIDYTAYEALEAWHG